MVAVKETALKQKLINTCKILAKAGQGEFIWGHATVRSEEDPNYILMKPHKIGLEEVTPENIIAVDIEGELVAGNGPRHLEVYLHTEVMRVRPDVMAVIHTHAHSAVVFSCLGKKLQPIAHAGSLFYDGLPLYDKGTDLIVDKEGGADVAQGLGNFDAMLMANHGLLTVGANIEQALLRALFLDKACETQMQADALGGAVRVSNERDASSKKRELLSQAGTVFDYLTRQLG